MHSFNYALLLSSLVCSFNASAYHSHQNETLSEFQIANFICQNFSTEAQTVLIYHRDVCNYHRGVETSYRQMKKEIISQAAAKVIDSDKILPHIKDSFGKDFSNANGRLQEKVYEMWFLEACQDERVAQTINFQCKTYNMLVSAHSKIANTTVETLLNFHPILAFFFQGQKELSDQTASQQQEALGILERAKGSVAQEESKWGTDEDEIIDLPPDL